MQRSQELFNQAISLIPGGVNSPVRAFRAVGGTPRFIASASGCHVTDVDGNQYIDYVGSWGAMIAGHAHPDVITAVEAASRRGISYGMPCPAEVDLAREVVSRVPGLERIRFVNSGTEAVMSAIRLARAFTGRNGITKFEGCYHGHCDAMLTKAGSGVATLGLPDSPGVTPGASADTLVAEYNNLDSVSRLMESRPGQIAAIIIEPICGNMGVVIPAPGFLAGLKNLAEQHGALLIFDEVMTGFRVSAGSVANMFDVTPDLWTFGKIIGGGLPVGAYGGRAEIMDHVAPQGSMYQAGTLAGNPLAMAAGIATLRLLSPQVYDELERKSARLASGIGAAANAARVPVVVQRAASMLAVFFADHPIRNMNDARRCDHARFARFFHAMLDRGVHLPPSGYEAWFVSMAHDDRVIDETIDTVARAFQTIAS